MLNICVCLYHWFVCIQVVSSDVIVIFDLVFCTEIKLFKLKLKNIKK